jgi:hypothetical protein
VDINWIAAETQGVELLTQHGPGVHRDLCHVVQHCSLGQMSSFRLPGEHPHGLFIYVSCSWPCLFFDCLCWAPQQQS